MNSSPLFSILIPTKNRAHLVGFAIQSVLNQTCHDFEIVLVDNDDGSATSKVLENFKDSRLRYVRSGGLNMSENWEFALDHARGKYVTVLEDKQAYYPWTLEKISTTLEASECPVLLWEWDLYQDKKSQARRASRPGDTVIMTSNKILEHYTSNPHEAWSVLPRMLNCAASRVVINNIRQNPNVRRFFDELTPDLCSGFQLLASMEEVLVLREGLGLTGYVDESNAKKWATAKQPWKYIGGSEAIVEESVRYVPIKLEKLIHNIVYNDYLRIQKNLGGRLAQYSMAPMIYLRLCLREVMRGLFIGSTRLTDLRALVKYASENDIGYRYLPRLTLYAASELVKSMIPVDFKANWSQTWHAETIVEAAQQLESPQIRIVSHKDSASKP